MKLYLFNYKISISGSEGILTTKFWVCVCVGPPLLLDLLDLKGGGNWENVHCLKEIA